MPNQILNFILADGTPVSQSITLKPYTYPVVNSYGGLACGDIVSASITPATMSLVDDQWQLQCNLQSNNDWYINTSGSTVSIISGSTLSSSYCAVTFNSTTNGNNSLYPYANIQLTPLIKNVMLVSGSNNYFVLGDTLSYVADANANLTVNLLQIPYLVVTNNNTCKSYKIQPSGSSCLNKDCLVTTVNVSNVITPQNKALYAYPASDSDARYVLSGSQQTIDTSSLVSNTTFNYYTSSNDDKVTSLIAHTSSYLTTASIISSSISASYSLKAISSSYLSGSTSIVNKSNVAGNKPIQFTTQSISTTGNSPQNITTWELSPGDSYIYVANYNSGTIDIFISIPSQNYLVYSDTITIGGNPAGLKAIGSILFAVTDTLFAYDLNNYSTPITSISLGGQAEAVTATSDGKYVYVAHSNTVIETFYFDGSSFTSLGSINVPYANCIDIDNIDNYLYVVGTSQQLVILDISNHSTPVLVGSIITPNGPINVVYQNSKCYVTCIDDNLFVIYDVSNKTSPKELGRIGLLYANGVSISTNSEYAYVTANETFYVLEVSDSTYPTIVTTINNLDSRLLVTHDDVIYGLNETSNTLTAISNNLLDSSLNLTEWKDYKNNTVGSINHGGYATFTNISTNGDINFNGVLLKSGLAYIPPLATSASYYNGSVTSASYSVSSSAANSITFIPNLSNTASYYNGTVTSASYSVSASYIKNSVSASYYNTSSLVTLINTKQSTIATGSTYNITASYILNSQTSSYITASNISGTISSSSYALSASYIPNLYPVNLTGYELTSSFNNYTSSNDIKVNSLIAQTSSYLTTSSVISSSITASYSPVQLPDITNNTVSHFTGINQPNPQYTLDVSGDIGNSSGNLILSASVIPVGDIYDGNDIILNTPQGYNILDGFLSGSSITLQGGKGNMEEPGDIIVSSRQLLVNGNLNFTGNLVNNGSPYIPSSSISASFASTASYVKNSITASYYNTSSLVTLINTKQSTINTGSTYNITASAINFIPNLSNTSSYNLNSISSSYSLSASWSPQPTIPTTVTSSITSLSSSISNVPAGGIYYLVVVSGSGNQPDYIDTADLSYNQATGQTWLSSLSASNVTASLLGTSSWSNNSISSSYVPNLYPTDLTGYTLTSSFNNYTSSNDGKVNSLISHTSSYLTTSSVITTASYALTSSYVSGSVKCVGNLTLTGLISNGVGVNGANSQILSWAPVNVGYPTGTDCLYVGMNAGAYNSQNFNTFIGYQSGYNAPNVLNSIFIGYQTGNNGTSAANSNFLGYQSGKTATNASGSNFLGYQSGNSAFSASYSNFIGYQAGSTSIAANNSIFIGYKSGVSDTVNNSNNKSSILIGDYTSTNGYSDSICIGKGTQNTTNNQLNIGNVIYATSIYSGSSATGSAQITGKVGIGLNNPINTLDVVGNISCSVVTASIFNNNGYNIPIILAGSASISAATSKIITFTNNMPSVNYAVSLTGESAITTPSVAGKTTSGFTASFAIYTGNLDWICVSATQ